MQRKVVSYADGVTVGTWLLDANNQAKYAAKGFDQVAKAIKADTGIELTAGAIRFKAQALAVDTIYRARHAITRNGTDKVIHALEEASCLLGERVAKLERRLAWIEKELGI